MIPGKSIYNFFEAAHLYQPNYILLEGQIPVLPDVKEDIKNEKVQRMIDISKKYFVRGLTPQEKREAQDLVEDPKVQSILITAERVGRRKGWIKGTIVGTVAGGITGAILASELAAPVHALILLGALVGGATLGYITSKINAILMRWKAEENMSSGKGVRVQALE